MVTHAEGREWAIAGTEAVLGREPTLAEVQFVQAVALLESGNRYATGDQNAGYGQGWEAAGKGSNNMGAVQAGKPPCDPATSFLYTDSHPQDDGTSVKYEWCYKKYPTPQDGMADVAHILYEQMGIKPTSIEAVSTQMYDKHYYEGFGATREERIAGHIDALNLALENITDALNEPMPPYSVHDEPSGDGDGSGMLMLLGFTGVLLVGGFVMTNRSLVR